ncbi:hypothetical protein ACSEQ5_16790 [Pseudomonas aeruginosa]
MGRLDDSSLVARIITDNHHLICASPATSNATACPGIRKTCNCMTA